MLNICMLVHNRPELTRQSLKSLMQNASGDFTVLMFDDYSTTLNVHALLDLMLDIPNKGIRLQCSPLKIGPGASRNISIAFSQKCFGRGDYLYLCDNDCFFLPGWDKALLAAWPIAKEMGFKALGGYAHPYQQPISTHNGINELAALGLLSWLMDWDTFDRYGAFDPSPDINGSEDWLYSQKIRRDGFKVGALAEPVIINCGATSSNGKPCPGASTLYEQKIPPGVLIL